MPDGRGAFLVCPACAGPMLEVRVGEEQAAVDVCETCRGVWFDWFDGETSDLARSIPTVDGSAPVGKKNGACPRDGAPLETHAYLDSGPEVERCPTCLGLFAPRARIPQLRAFHQRMPETKAPDPVRRESLLARLWHAFAG